jgi:hypothetical protein
MVYIDLTNMDMTHNLQVCKVCLYSVTVELEIRHLCLHESDLSMSFCCPEQLEDLQWPGPPPGFVIGLIVSELILHQKRTELNPLQLIPCKKCICASRNILHFGRT